MVKVSIIVPVYNVAPYLARCLDSLIGQTLRDIEIICVDDKSTDNSLEILREYEKKDPRVTVIALERNSGVATARNVGIAAARGEYLGFVDSDDYVDTDFYEKLYAAACRDNADMARGNCKITDYANQEHIEDNEITNVQNRGKWFFDWQWWCAIYRAANLSANNIQFPVDVISGQDTVFLVACLGKANKVSVSKDTFYHYVRREGSLDEKIMPPHKIASRMKAYSLVTDLLNSTQDLDKKNYVRLYINFMICTLGHSKRNTSTSCKSAIANALVDMYKKCLHKTAVSYGLKSVFGSRAITFIQSYDVENLEEYLVKQEQGTSLQSIQKKNTVCSRKYTCLLFGLLPLLQFHKSTKKLLIRFCGIQILKIKRGSSSSRATVFYIPIIRIKKK